MSVLDLQKRLKSLGFEPGPLDGDLGPQTLTAINKALDQIRVLDPLDEPKTTLSTVPASWMPWARMDRIIWHWTAGRHKASALDKRHYHILIEDDGKLVRGDPPIDANAAPHKPNYAQHTLNCNTGSIGVSMCGMLGAVESPFDPGAFPITRTQWTVLATVLTDLCRRYTIPVRPGTVLSHAEVEKTLGIKQRQKWDVSRLPFNPALKGATAIGSEMRSMVKP